MLCPRGFRKQIKSKSGRLYASTLHACSLFLVQRFEKPVLTTSGHQKMIPPHSFRLHLILGGKSREHATKPRCGWWTGSSRQAREEATRPGKTKCMLACATKPNKWTPWKRRKPQRTSQRGWQIHTAKSLPPNPPAPPKPHLHSALKRKHSGAGEVPERLSQ